MDAIKRFPEDIAARPTIAAAALSSVHTATREPLLK